MALLFIATTSNSIGSEELQVWNNLKDGKVVALMRHAIAPGNGDPSEFTIGDCKTQRNLSSEGVQQAQSIGAQIKAFGISDVDIYSSQWCRCTDTGTELDFGAPQELPILNSFYEDRSTAEQQTNELRKWITEHLSIDKPNNNAATKSAILVTHQVNITALTGVYPSSGEIVFVAMNNDELEVVTSVVLPR